MQLALARIGPRAPGGVPERLNGAVSKTVGVARRSWVRIPPPPLCRAVCRLAAGTPWRNGNENLGQVEDSSLSRGLSGGASFPRRSLQIRAAPRSRKSGGIGDVVSRGLELAKVAGIVGALSDFYGQCAP
jgi:hypothetical protein